MQSGHQRRRMSIVSFVRLFSGRRRTPAALAEQRERLATTAELSELRLAR
ncbi:hypothetical protein [Gordonia sp. (in: high G+C Gram-positive bacteria)]